MLTSPLPVTSEVTSNSYHWPTTTEPSDEIVDAPNVGLLFQVTPVSVHEPLIDRTSPPKLDGFTQKRRSFALATPFGPTPLTENLRRDRLNGLPSTWTDVFVPKFEVPRSCSM